MSSEKTTETNPGTETEQAEARSPEEIREDIEQTREEMSDTVEALAGKTDVKGQAKAKVQEVKENVQQKREEFTAKASDSAPDSAGAAAQQVRSTVQENPTPFIVGGAVVLGFLLGRVSRG